MTRSPVRTLSLGAALEEAARGARIRRLAWADPLVVVFFKNDVLMIEWADGTVTALLVSRQDVADDWVTVG